MNSNVEQQVRAKLEVRRMIFAEAYMNDRFPSCAAA